MKLKAWLVVQTTAMLFILQDDDEWRIFIKSQFNFIIILYLQYQQKQWIEFIIFMFHTTVVATLCLSVLMNETKPILWNIWITIFMFLSSPLAPEETGLEVNSEETKYMFMSRDQHAGLMYSFKAVN